MTLDLMRGQRGLEKQLSNSETFLTAKTQRTQRNHNPFIFWFSPQSSLERSPCGARFKRGIALFPWER